MNRLSPEYVLAQNADLITHFLTPRHSRSVQEFPGDTSSRVAEPAAPAPELPTHITLAVEDWLARDIAAPASLMGHWLTTTSRALAVASTGLGKTLFLMALGMAASEGSDFLHWKGSGRPARVLYIDGEMSSRLLRQRLADECGRRGSVPKTFYALSHEDIEGFAPLNTPAGQACIEKIIERIGGIDLIIFDSIMCLTIGEMRGEVSWAQTMPWVRSLTKRKIALIWIHHTGHDKTKSYGDNTREWQMDTVLHMEAVYRDDTDVSFSLEFRKARERTPATRADFQDLRVALVDDQWARARRGKLGD